MSQQMQKTIDQDYVNWQANIRLEEYGHPDQPDDLEIAANLQDLFSRDGDAFIRLAFRTFLGREPDPAELQQCRDQLSSGVGKSALAAELRYCPEAAGRPQQLQLDKVHWFEKLTALPVIGYLVKLAATLALSPGLKRSLLIQQEAIQGLRQVQDSQRTATHGALRDIVQSEEQLKLERQHLQAQLDALTRELRQEVKSLRDRQEALDDSLHQLQPGSDSSREESQGTPIDSGFYIAFEEHFRGSEDVIRQRLTYYLPVLEQKLPITERTPRAVDIGCGRGEWISLLQQAGYAATGIDLNAANVATCQDKGLDAVQADGILWLRQTESRSLALISSFHVVEHLSLAQINSLLIEALRCLEPGGLLILETPNPENLVTAANRFYTDPSHRNPMPPDLLEFLLKYKGFTEVEIHRLHPVEGDTRFTEDSTMATTLNHLLFGPQDYAVIARKP